MNLPEASRLQFAPDLCICRVLNGMWQVSGAHGYIDPKSAVQSMFTYLDSGFTTWDLADHYGPAEDFIGEFRRQLVFSQSRSVRIEATHLGSGVLGGETPVDGGSSRVALRLIGADVPL